MAFVMPAEYTLENLPKPVDPLVEIKPIPAKKVAVIRYSGSLNEDNINQKANELMSWLQQRNLKMLSPARSAAYDPPWTLPALRRNEVHIDIE
jgi:DNA gyrase inhibitor GyrI